MTLANKLKNRMPKKVEYPLWKGPQVDGITQSMLSRFLQCRERFRVNYLEGIQPVDRFNHKLFYGDLWHACREAELEGCIPFSYMGVLLKKVCAKYPFDQKQVAKWFQVCLRQYLVYKEWLQSNSFALNEADSILSEQTFRLSYTLPCGTVVQLRGKFDGIVQYKGKYWLVENKTKGQVSPHKVSHQLKFDLQTMFYLTAMSRDYDSIGGVIYDVVKRPLSGGKGTIRQRKTRGTTPAETEEEFYNRLEQVFRDNPDEFFFSWEVPVTANDITEFQTKFLNPTLIALVTWYNGAVEAGKKNPFDNPHHSLTPFELFRPLQELGSTELDDYILTGDRAGLTTNTTLFEELD